MNTKKITEINQELSEITFFANVGKEVQANKVEISSWAEALEMARMIEWENFRLYGRGQLTEGLAKNYPDQFQQWNSIALSFISEIEKLAHRAMEKVPIEYRSDVSKYLEWDLLNYCMEKAYEQHIQVLFYRDIIEIYKQGRFPCGVGKSEEDAKILIF